MRHNEVMAALSALSERVKTLEARAAADAPTAATPSAVASRVLSRRTATRRASDKMAVGTSQIALVHAPGIESAAQPSDAAQQVSASAAEDND
jgi:hypothetical protein